MPEKKPLDIAIPSEDREAFVAKQKEEKGNTDMTRRAFLIGAAATAAGYVIGDSFLKKERSEQEDTLKVPDQNAKAVVSESVVNDPSPRVISQEEIPVVLTPLEQLKAYGKVRNMKAGLQIVHDEHYAKLVHTGEGKRDMEVSAKNIRKYDTKKLIQPFLEKGLPEELAYMIVIQETRGNDKVSHRGARGITGILSRTARALGFGVKTIKDPYLASKVTAEYLATERAQRFGDAEDVDILLHAYNAGGGLFGFTQQTPKEERTSKNFYAYMQEYVNKKFTDYKKNGYIHELDDEDKTLTHVSKRFGIPLQKLLNANKLAKTAIVHKGDRLVIPFASDDDAMKVIFRKPMEALRYAPELKAKFKALRDTGLLTTIDAQFEQRQQGALG